MRCIISAGASGTRLHSPAKGVSKQLLPLYDKPHHPKSDEAFVGLFFYPNEVLKITKKLDPSAWGELEITSVNLAFLKNGKLQVKLLGRGFAWLDNSNHEFLIEKEIIHSFHRKTSASKTRTRPVPNRLQSVTLGSLSKITIR